MKSDQGQGNNAIHTGKQTDGAKEKGLSSNADVKAAGKVAAGKVDSGSKRGGRK